VKQQKWIMGPAVMALALGTVGMMNQAAMAQPATTGNNAAGAGQQRKANRAARAQRAGKGARAALIAPQALERMLGKPLTEEQRKAVDAAAQTYMDSVAKAVGLTAEELKAKATEYRRTQRENRKVAPTQ
jgi:hypothetical protein